MTTEWLLSKHHVISVLLLVCFLFPLLWLSQYNYPSGDDYLAFFQAHRMGTLGAVKWWYHNWNGRYTAFFLQSLFPEHSVWLAAYRIIPIALLLGGFACLFYFMRAQFGTGFGKRALFTLSACTYIFLVSLTPDMASGFYWLATNIQYLGAVFISLLILTLYIDLERATRPSTRGVLLVVVIILIGFLAGLNEISMLFFIGTVSSVSLFQLIKFKKPPILGLILLAVGIPFTLCAFLAPGNFVRASKMSPEADWLQAMASAVGSTASLSWELLTSTPLLIASALYLAALNRNRDRLSHLVSFLSGVRWYWVVLSLFCVTSSINLLILVKVGMPSLMVERVQNAYVFSILLVWLFLLNVVFVDLTSHGLRVHIPKPVVGVLAVAMVLFLATGFGLRWRNDPIASGKVIQTAASSIATDSIYANAYLDILSGRAAIYGRENEETTKRYRAANDGCVEFLPPAHVVDTIFVRFVKYPSKWCPKEYVRLYGGASP
jgi:Family of unknown function (DUF6056)